MQFVFHLFDCQLDLVVVGVAIVVVGVLVGDEPAGQLLRLEYDFVALLLEALEDLRQPLRGKGNTVRRGNVLDLLVYHFAVVERFNRFS